MLPNKLRNELHTITTVEAQQISQGGINIQDVPVKNITTEKTIKSMPFWSFFDCGKVAVTRSNRFSYIPAHTHDFIEINYVYSGRSIQYIDDQKIILQPGQLIIMDRDVQQRISYARKQDILLNILIKDNGEISKLLYGQDVSANLLKRFIYNASKINFNHDNYLVLDSNNSPITERILESIIISGWKNNGDNNILLELLLQSFFLSPDCLIINKKINFVDAKEDSMLQMLSYLNSHYQDITLVKLATHFGYSPNYLGDKIKQELGYSFKSILQMRRLNIACNLLQQTKLSMNEISLQVGYENHSSLFRLFKNLLNTTPSEYRDKVIHPQHLDEDANNIFNLELK